MSVIKVTGNVVRQYGVLALYNGLSASLCRQLSYSTTCFGIYEVSLIFLNHLLIVHLLLFAEIQCLH